MLERTVTVREGEWFTDGTADEWIAEHARLAGQHSHPALTPDQESMIRKLAGPPPVGDYWVIREDDYWHKLQRVGLYDGWVYWHKRIVLGTDGPLPVEHHHEAYRLRAISGAVSAIGPYQSRVHRRVGAEVTS